MSLCQSFARVIASSSSKIMYRLETAYQIICLIAAFVHRVLLCAYVRIACGEP
jgi:hypothetical protein